MSFVPARVLLIETDDEFRALTDQVLKIAGYQVEHVPDDVDPVAFAELTRPSVIVVGIGQRHREDIQVVDDVHTNPSTAAIPVIAYTLLRKSEFTCPVCANGQVTLIAPYTVNSLEAAVADALLKSLHLFSRSPDHPVAAG